MFYIDMLIKTYTLFHQSLKIIENDKNRSSLLRAIINHYPTDAHDMYERPRYLRAPVV